MKVQPIANETLEKLILKHEKYRQDEGTWQACELRAFLELQERRKAEGLKPNLRLGELIDALAACPPTECVSFDFCDYRPVELISYRGYYDHLAITRVTGSRGGLRVGELLGLLTRALGDAFEGYKGGSYVATRETPLWVDEYSECTSIKIVGVAKREFGGVVLLTEYGEYLATEESASPAPSPPSVP